MIKLMLFFSMCGPTVFCHSYNIVGVFPLQAKSHFRFIDPLMVRLAEKGHKVTSYNAFPKNYRIPNYVDISLRGCYYLDDHFASFDTLLEKSSNPFVSALRLTEFDFDLRKFEKCAPLMRLLNSTENYDLLVTETFVTDFTLIFSAKFQIPFVSSLPNQLVPWLTGRLGNPSNPSYFPNIFSGRSSPMNYIERVQNTLLHLETVFVYNLWNLRKADEVFQHFLGQSAPSVYDVVKNASVILTNAHESFGSNLPQVPGIVNVGGMHIKLAHMLPKVNGSTFS